MACLIRFIASDRIPRLFVGEVQVPQTVIPFQCDLPPSQGNLRVGIEWSDVRPCRCRILLRIGNSGVVRVRCVAWPSVVRHIGLVVARNATTVAWSTLHRHRSGSSVSDRSGGNGSIDQGAWCERSRCSATDHRHGRGCLLHPADRSNGLPYGNFIDHTHNAWDALHGAEDHALLIWGSDVAANPNFTFDRRNIDIEVAELTALLCRSKPGQDFRSDVGIFSANGWFFAFRKRHQCGSIIVSRCRYNDLFGRGCWRQSWCSLRQRGLLNLDVVHNFLHPCGCRCNAEDRVELGT